MPPRLLRQPLCFSNREGLLYCARTGRIRRREGGLGACLPQQRLRQRVPASRRRSQRPILGDTRRLFFRRLGVCRSRRVQRIFSQQRLYKWLPKRELFCTPRKQEYSLCNTSRHCWASTCAFLPTHGVRHTSVHSTAGSKATSPAPLRLACTLWAPSMQHCAAPLLQQACASHRATPPMGSEDLFRAHITMAAPPSDCVQHLGTDVFASQFRLSV